MSGDLHGDLLFDPGLGQMPRTGSSQIVNQKPSVSFPPSLFLALRVASRLFDELTKARSYTRGLPCLSKVADLLAVEVKDKRAVKAPDIGSLLDDLPEPSGQRQDPGLFVFCVRDL